jgi:uncharacterized membrane protein (UPF0136 family)
MGNGNIVTRMDAVERLVALFRMERIVHLVVTTISLTMLLGSAAYLIVQSRADTPTLVALFGSSGLITYSANRLLRMWDQALEILIEESEAENV